MITVAEFEAFFKDKQLPLKFDVNSAVHVTNVLAMVNSHLATLKASGITATFAGFYERLVQLKEYMEKQHS